MIVQPSSVHLSGGSAPTVATAVSAAADLPLTTIGVKLMIDGGTVVDVEHEWLRAERSYRSYVRGLRLGMLGFAVAVLFGPLGAWILPRPAVIVGTLLGFGLAVPGVLMGAIGWLLVPDKVRISTAQLAFIRMAVRNMVRGIPHEPEVRS